MILRSVRVQNFKCIDDSHEFSVDGLTCLVGKNESGKGALLEALYKLNPVVDGNAAFLDLEYPRRRWSEYKERHAGKQDNVLTTVWELTEPELEIVVEAVGGKSLKGARITISKGYSNRVTWTIPHDEKEAVKFLVKKAKLPKEELSEFGNSDTLREVVDKLKAMESPSERHSEFLARIEAAFPEARVGRGLINLLDPHMPKFIYFTEYSRLPGQVSLDQLQTDIARGSLSEEQLVFIALLSLTGTTPDELPGITKFEPLIAELEAVSNRLSQEIFAYWSQNKHLEVDFRFDAARPEDPPPLNSGFIFRTRIRNRRHGVTVGFDERSSGFVWFFSFLVWFSQMKKNFGDKLVILLDEPGLSLHARAQADLLRYMKEKLCPNYQVIYTSHSPFMIDPENLLSARTVEDVETSEGDILGTKVGDEVFSTDADTVFPLQAALGYEITQTLFVGKDTLLVEGPSDLLYLKWFSNELRREGKAPALDQRWVITPCGGVDKVASFMALFGGNKLHVAVLTDFTSGQKGKIRSLQESELLRAGHVLTADKYAGQSEADIEDVIGRDNYVIIVNQCYGLKDKKRLPDSKPTNASRRVIEEVESHFRTLSPDDPEFDHYTPAEYLLEHGEELRTHLPDLAGATKRFAKLFDDLNGLLAPD